MKIYVKMAKKMKMSKLRKKFFRQFKRCDDMSMSGWKHVPQKCFEHFRNHPKSRDGGGRGLVKASRKCHGGRVKVFLKPTKFDSDRAMSNQICDERTKFDILCAFVNVSLCLTHRKHSIQRALNSPGSGELFKYVERAWKVHKKFFTAIQSQKLHPKHDNSHIKLWQRRGIFWLQKFSNFFFKSS